MNPEDRYRAFQNIQASAKTDREARDRLWQLWPEMYKRMYYTLPGERMTQERSRVDPAASAANAGGQNLGQDLNPGYWDRYTSEVGLSPENDAAYRAWLQTAEGKGAATGMNDFAGGPVTLSNFTPEARGAIERANAPAAATSAASAPAAQLRAPSSQAAAPAGGAGQAVSTARLAEARRAGIDLNALAPDELAAFVQGGSQALQQLRWTAEAARRPANPNLMD